MEAQLRKVLKLDFVKGVRFSARPKNLWKKLLIETVLHLLFKIGKQERAIEPLIRYV